MSEFKKYRRKQVAELRPITNDDVKQFRERHKLETKDGVAVSISEPDIKNNSPKIGDMVARNPKNHSDQWLVAEDYFKDNFEEA